jgi:hypothetical protein
MGVAVNCALIGNSSITAERADNTRTMQRAVPILGDEYNLGFRDQDDTKPEREIGQERTVSKETAAR